MTALLNAAYEEAFRRAVQVVEFNICPDILVRTGIRYLLAKRARESTPASGEQYYTQLQEFVDDLKKKPVAVSAHNIMCILKKSENSYHSMQHQTVHAL
jgi:hypothetical protein